MFNVVAFPVEIDASQRALVWLNTSRLTKGEEQTQATTALKWAAGTYVVAALASVPASFKTRSKLNSLLS